MNELLASIAIGFVLGMRHATDPDHVIAVTTIVSRQASIRGAALIGATWGIGHTLTIALVGGAIIVFHIVIPPALGLMMELGVALMLVVLGVLTLTGTLDRIGAAMAPFKVRNGSLRYQPAAPGHRHGLVGLHAHATAHAHPHAHGDYAHSHRHGHDAVSHGHAEDATPQAWLDRHFGGLGAYQLLRPLLVGVVHGLAGSAAVALLIVAAITNPAEGLAYLLLFGLGTIAGMMLVTAIIALPFAASAKRLPQLNTILRVASGVASLGFGLYLMYDIGFVHGLFTGNPNWNPH